MGVSSTFLPIIRKWVMGNGKRGGRGGRGERGEMGGWGDGKPLRPRGYASAARCGGSPRCSDCRRQERQVAQSGGGDKVMGRQGEIIPFGPSALRPNYHSPQVGGIPITNYQLPTANF